MQEFSSISVSSYEAGGLVDQLTQQARAGWSVVAIVPTGSTVTAYLSRTSEAADDTDGVAGAGAVDTPVVAATPTPAEPTIEPAAEPTAEASSDPSPAEVPGGAVTDSVGAAPGWAAGSTTAADADADTSAPDTSASDTAASDTADVGTGESDTGDRFTVADEPAAEPATAEASSSDTTTTAAAAGAAPAGWYADPSSRFELRYWDGGQWTEHVSRAGQQYTDPPVA